MGEKFLNYFMFILDLSKPVNIMWIIKEVTNKERKKTRMSLVG